MFWPWVQAIDNNRVAQLAESFRSGDYGVNIMKKPSLLEFDGQPKIDAQGARLLCDGKHTIAALKELGAELAANEALAETWTNALVAAIRTGASVIVVEFEDDDPDVVLAFNSLAHDLDSNKYKATSLKDLVDVAKRYKARTPSGEWCRVQKVLMSLYGENKRSAHQQ
jgi:hypothetical protein